jgi:hypothetical protein
LTSCSAEVASHSATAMAIAGTTRGSFSLRSAASVNSATAGAMYTSTA